MLKEEKLQQAYRIMQTADRVLLITHLRPDGDALSSLCALQLVLQRLGKKTVSFCADKQDDSFSYLPGFFDIIDNRLDFEKEFLADSSLKGHFDLIVVADCGSLARTTLSEELIEFKKQGGIIIEFDHHPKVDDYSSLEIREVGLSSTAELVYDFIVTNNIKFDRQLADCVLTGVMADTGNFLYPSATEKTMQVASEALSTGARYTKIFQTVTGTKNFKIMKLWGLVLDRLQLNPKYNMAISLITRKDLQEIFGGDKLDKATESETFSNLVGFLSNSSGAKSVLLLYEDQAGFVKGSLRSTPNGYLIDGLARYLGGGGHERAAGFAIPGRLEKIDNNWQVIS